MKLVKIAQKRNEKEYYDQYGHHGIYGGEKAFQRQHEFKRSYKAQIHKEIGYDIEPNAVNENKVRLWSILLNSTTGDKKNNTLVTGKA